MDEFEDILDELNLVDVKMGNGWFTWSNNREGANLIKERLDRFLVSEDLIEKLSFITFKMVLQSKSDHEVILLGTLGSQLGDKGGDYKSSFRYEVCWAKVQEAKDIITRIWADKDSNILNIINNLSEELGPWQYHRYKRMKYKIHGLERKIGKIMDGPINERLSNFLKATRD
ncbi:hypothetical protein PVK06_032849 [Gossypium arboreum]|uniref:Reverse transcriptase n=1 Tax=Gossypium arboreum TaxID=29729 RepID=A0ABR0NUZ9_GOSAR|nr:hypothetical protein PVK06_032849 [Gossypium arboreum]